MKISAILLVLLLVGWTASTMPAYPTAPAVRKVVPTPESPETTDYATADSIDGIYIPRNLEECMTELDKHISDSLKTVILEEDYTATMLHLSLGMWIRNNFGLWRDSRLAHYLRNNGPCADRMDEPDDMSDYILSEYLEHLKQTHEKN